MPIQKVKMESMRKEVKSDQALALLFLIDNSKDPKAILKEIIKYANKNKDDEAKAVIGLGIEKIADNLTNQDLGNIKLKTAGNNLGIEILSELYGVGRGINNRVGVLKKIAESVRGKPFEPVEHLILSEEKVIPLGRMATDILRKAGDKETAGDLNIAVAELEINRSLNPDMMTIWDKSKQKGMEALFQLGQKLSVMKDNYNWCGPGTDIYRNLKEGLLPTNKLDKACYLHDMDYARLSISNDGLSDEERAKEVRESDERLLRVLKEGMDDKDADLARDASLIYNFMNKKVFFEEQKKSDPLRFLGPFVEKLTEDEKQSIMDTVERDIQLVLDDEKIREEQPEQVESLRSFVKAKMGEQLKTEDINIMSAKERDRQRAGQGPPPPPPPESMTTTTPLEIDFNMGNKVVGGKPVVGDRNMAPFLVHSNGDELEKSEEQKDEDTFNYENFMWVDAPNSNVHRLPFIDYRNSKITDNFLIDTRRKSERLKYSMPLLMQGEVKKETYPSMAMLQSLSRTYIPDVQRTQQFIRTSTRDRKFGKIQMYRESPYLSEYKNQNSKYTRLTNPDVVNGNIRL